MTEYVCDQFQCTTHATSYAFQTIQPEAHHMWDVLAIIGALCVLGAVIFGFVCIWEWVENVNHLRKRVMQLESTKRTRKR